MRLSRWAGMASLIVAANTTVAHADDYRLGPEDQVQVKVYDLRAGTGEAHQWTAFNGDFSVDAAGRLALPLVGPVDAGGRTTAEVAGSVAALLQAKVGLADRPDASVQVIKYRPFYVTGSVERPGGYEFRPNLTVDQAVSLAGGAERVSRDAVLGYAREAATTRGDLRALAAEHLALVARQARLDAEVKGSAAITVPEELSARAAEPDVARILREETLLFQAHRDALASQVSVITQNKTLLSSEITSLKSKDASLERQLDASRKELDQIKGLVSKGLTVLPRQLDLERTTASFEGSRLDVAIAALRAQQDLAKADRDIIDLQTARRTQSLQEAADVRDKLTQTDERMATALRLIRIADARSPFSLSADPNEMQPTYAITRTVNGATSTIQAKATDSVMPGDVIRVAPRKLGEPSGTVVGNAG